ncbi:MAG: hypothetical protein WDO73_10005 [Ignavibacteriota bacterium]
MSSNQSVGRRDILTAAGTVLTTSLFTGQVKGANDRNLRRLHRRRHHGHLEPVLRDAGT